MTEKGKNRKRNFRFESLQLHAGHTLDIIATRARAVQFISSSRLYERMVALEGEINVISTSSGWTVQFVAISTIRSATLPNWGSMSNLFKAMIQKNRRIR
ncbi:O-acetylhomoserine/O-acetylserine sulfhydrylase [Rhizophagus irregularis DAOM 181602=DAOM 197198]|nr:O-acetylhomoserine/O-acetylserine sulfhydrylase [Rhizophagus irregularis DAOM 181602=DAOM 197198]